MFENRCYNGGLRHKYQPRYSWIRHLGAVNIESVSVEVTRTLTHNQVYKGDVCVWCGNVVNDQNN